MKNQTTSPMATIRSPNLSAVALCGGFVVLVLFLSGCWVSTSTPNPLPGRVRVRHVIVSVEPHAFLVERISGGRVIAEVIVPTGKDPESYQPTPSTIKTLTSAGAWFQTGLGFEPFLRQKLESLSQTPVPIIDLRQGIPLRSLELHSGHDADGLHHHDLDCSHDGLDPHIWLSPAALLIQAKTVYKTLREIEPEWADFFTENYEQLEKEIDAVQKNLSTRLAPLRGKTVFVYHPAYGYFCDEFGLRQEAIEIEGRSPKPQQIAAWIEKIKSQPQKPAIIVQPQFDQTAAKAIAEATGCEVVPHSPLERNILENLQRLEGIIRPPATDESF